jgi:hypothetical protein
MMQEEEWAVMEGVEEGEVDGDSVRAVRFLDGRREVESPFPWAESPEDRSTTNSSEEPRSLLASEIESDDSWTECGAHFEERRRKDSGFEVGKSAKGSLDDVQTHAQAEELEMPNEHIPYDPPVSPTSPITIGPQEGLDWFRFSFLVRNNELSFDDIADLVTQCAPESNGVKQQKSLTVIPPNEFDSSANTSTGRPGKLSQLFEYDVSPLEGEPPCPFSNFIGRLEKFSDGAEPKKLSGETVRHQEDEIKGNIPVSQGLQERDHLQNDFSSDVSDVRQSCFSSGSSLCIAEDEGPAKGKAWWKPKRKLDSTSKT